MAAIQAAGAGTRQVLPAPQGRVGFGGALRSEFTKIRSVRSTYWTLLAMAIVSIGFGALASWGAAAHASKLGPGFDPTQQSLAGLYISQLIIAVLGALTVTSEYSTGMIRTSLTAQPRRGVVFAAKAVVFAGVALVTGLLTSFCSFFLGQALMSGKHIDATLAQPHVLRAVIGGGLFLAACGMLAFGLGMILRHTAAAITTAIGLLFVLTVVVTFLPQSWQDHVDKWMPAFAGSQVWSVQGGGPHSLSAWAGFATLAAYAAAAILVGVVVFRSRDA
jgi:ABC-type transport system involved in multi-copper enzyme maturation permease subunit